MGDRAGRHRWIRRTRPTEDGERFVLTHTRNDKQPGRHINFWHVKDGHEYLFTFAPSAKYSRNRFWDEPLYRELLADLMSPKPSVEVVRFAVDGKYVFVTDEFKNDEIPVVPEPPQLPAGWDVHLDRLRRKAEFVELEMFAERPEPAPLILYGLHPDSSKERRWKLYPDNLKCQDIAHGDYVLVNTQNGPAPVLVTRIEEAGDGEQPTRSVVLKMTPRDTTPPKPKKKGQKRREMEEEKAKELAPFILYGKFDKSPEEYSWRLTPDKPKRQGIEPGDRVLVWTYHGWKQVTVTRIEPAEGKAQPAYRVKKKLTPEEIRYTK